MARSRRSAPIGIGVDASPAQASLRIMRQLPRDLRREVAKVLRSEARAVQRGAKAILQDRSAPPRSRTGETEKSLRIRSRAGGLVVLVESREDPVKGPVALFLETATQRGGRRVTRVTTSLVRNRQGFAQLRRSRRSVREGGSLGKPAYPFLTRAQEEREKQTTANVTRAATQVFEKASRRGLRLR